MNTHQMPEIMILLHMTPPPVVDGGAEEMLLSVNLAASSAPFSSGEGSMTIPVVFSSLPTAIISDEGVPSPSLPSAVGAAVSIGTSGLSVGSGVSDSPETRKVMTVSFFLISVMVTPVTRMDPNW